MLKGIKKKWTDITIALALPLVIWNGATGIYNQWEEVQDEKDVPRMIAAQRFDDMLFVWHMWCNDAISTTDQPDEGVKTACEQIPPVGTSYEEFQTFPKDSFVFGNNSSKELQDMRAAAQGIKTDNSKILMGIDLAEQKIAKIQRKLNGERLAYRLDIDLPPSISDRVNRAAYGVLSLSLIHI